MSGAAKYVFGGIFAWIGAGAVIMEFERLDTRVDECLSNIRYKVTPDLEREIHRVNERIDTKFDRFASMLDAKQDKEVIKKIK